MLASQLCQFLAKHLDAVYGLVPILVVAFHFGWSPFAFNKLGFSSWGQAIISS